MAESKTKSASLPKSQKHAVKRQALLNIAVHQMNNFGASSLNLAALAKETGLTRNAIYYYFPSRSDLAFQCFHQSCEIVAQDLVSARQGGENAGDHLRAFIEKSIAAERPSCAILTNLGLLPPAQSNEISALQETNLTTIQAMIADGISKSIFRPIPTDIAAHCLMGVINWVQLLLQWPGIEADATFRRRLAETTTELFFCGLSSGKENVADFKIDLPLLVARRFNAFDRSQALHEKKTQVIETASYLFNKYGIDGVSLDDIASNVGATKGTVYHYFDDKADIVSQCYDHGFARYNLFLETAGRYQDCGLQQIMTVLHLNIQAQAGTTAPLMAQPGILSLPSIYRDKFAIKNGDMLRGVISMFEQGISDGSCNAFDPSIMAQICGGTFFWLSKWRNDDTQIEPIKIADDICDIFLTGIFEDTDIRNDVFETYHNAN